MNSVFYSEKNQDNNTKLYFQMYSEVISQYEGVNHAKQRPLTSLHTQQPVEYYRTYDW